MVGGDFELLIVARVDLVSDDHSVEVSVEGPVKPFLRLLGSGVRGERGLLAVAVLAATDTGLAAKLDSYREGLKG